jgi:hypothetical protein
MAFEKGHRKFGGRKKGTRNKACELGRELAQAILFKKRYRKNLVKRLCDFDAPPRTEEFLWAYAFGMPLDPNRTPHSEPTEEPVEEVTPAVVDDDEEDDAEEENDDDKDEDHDDDP